MRPAPGSQQKAAHIFSRISICPASRTETWISAFTEICVRSVNHPESQIDQINFQYVIDGIIISPFSTLKFVKDGCGNESDQRVIIRNLWNEGIHAHEITHRLQAQLGEYADTLRAIRFGIAEVRLDL
jgi:hypothetical protein